MVKETKVMRLYRKMHKHYVKKQLVFAKCYQILIRLLFSCECPYSVLFGEGVELKHGGLGMVFHEKTVVGNNSLIYQNVTIAGTDKGVPIIGENVLIGAGAVIMGPVSIGNNVKIGANAVVVESVRDNVTVVGVPAKMIDK